MNDSCLMIAAFRYTKGKMALFRCLFICVSFFTKSGMAQTIIITNPASFTRTNEIIKIKRNTVGTINKHLVPEVKNHSHILISQLADENNDGVWDVLLVETSLDPHAKDTLTIGWVKEGQQTKFEKRTNVLLSLRSDTNIPSSEMNTATRYRGFIQDIARPFYQMEGPGIENDKVAFRTFFDYRNSKDIYGKITDKPILERVGVGASWHQLQPWGMDIFHTGNSLGAGGLAVEENEKIIRLGDADTSTYQALYEGALQASFALAFNNWDAGTGKKNGSETISMTKGDFYYTDDIRLDLNKDQQLIAGIANFGIDKVIHKICNSSFSYISTYGRKAEGTNTNLGVAILFSTGDYIDNRTTDTASAIPNTSYVKLKPSARGKMTIYFFACWEKTDKRFATQNGFDTYLQQVADELSNPISITRLHKGPF